MEQKNRRFIGLDFGVRTYEMCMYDENGKIVRSNGLTTPEGRQKLYSKLKPTDRVGIEMCSLTMKVAREMKSAVGCDVLLLHAGKLAVIYKSLKKTDKEDALKLARLVKTHEDEELPIVPLPSEVDLKRRRMIREAKQLRSDRTKEVNRLHALFVECGITDIKKKNLATKTSREKSLQLLEETQRRQAERICQVIDLVETQIAEVKKEIAVEVENDINIKNLQTVPGIGELTAVAYSGFVGDGSRFDNGAQVSNYLGLVPKLDISCDQVHYGNITKTGNPEVRSLLIMAAWSHVRFAKEDTVLKSKWQYLTLVRRMSKKKAIVFIARKMAEMMLAILKSGKPYSPKKFSVAQFSELAEKALKSA